MKSKAKVETPEKPTEIVGELCTGGLTHNNQNTVQPVALMRLGLFVPAAKKNNKKPVRTSALDASSELVNLDIVRSEGYTDIKINGPRLNMDNDFKTWIGVVRSLAENGEKDGRMEMSIKRFANLCGHKSTEMRKSLRDKITNSLLKIMTTNISFQRTYEEKNKDGSNKISLLMVHLINSVKYNEKDDTIIFYAEAALRDLYQFDHKVLLQLKVIKELPRKETAQALYTFIESLPSKPAPVSLARLRARLNLINASISSQNQNVRLGLKSLKEVGYLDYSEVKKGNTVYINIHQRNPKLKERVPEKIEREIKEDPNEEAKRNIIEKIGQLSKNLTTENIHLIEILQKSLTIL